MSYTILFSLKLDKFRERVNSYDNVELRIDANNVSFRVHYRRSIMAELSLTACPDDGCCFAGPHSFHLGPDGLDETVRIIDGLNPQNVLLIQVFRDQNMGHYLKMDRENFHYSSVARYDDSFLPIQMVGFGYEFGHKSATHLKPSYCVNVDIGTKKLLECFKQLRQKNDDAVRKKRHEKDDKEDDDNGKDNEEDDGAENGLMMDIDAERMRLRMKNKEPIIIEEDGEELRIQINEATTGSKLHEVGFNASCLEEWLEMADYYDVELVTICADTSKAQMMTFDHGIYQVHFYGAGI